MKKIILVYVILLFTVVVPSFVLPNYNLIAHADNIEAKLTEKKFIRVEIIQSQPLVLPPNTYFYTDGVYAGYLTLDTYYRDKNFLYHGFYEGYVSKGGYPAPSKLIK